MRQVTTPLSKSIITASSTFRVSDGGRGWMVRVCGWESEDVMVGGSGW